MGITTPEVASSAVAEQIRLVPAVTPVFGVIVTDEVKTGAVFATITDDWSVVEAPLSSVTVTSQMRISFEDKETVVRSRVTSSVLIDVGVKLVPVCCSKNEKV